MQSFLSAAFGMMMLTPCMLFAEVELQYKIPNLSQDQTDLDIMTLGSSMATNPFEKQTELDLFDGTTFKEFATDQQVNDAGGGTGVDILIISPIELERKRAISEFRTKSNPFLPGRALKPLF